MSNGWALAPYVASGLLTALCGGIVARRIAQPGAATYGQVLFAETAWTLGFILELLTPTLDGKIAWDDVQLVALAFMVVGIPKFVWEYSGRAPAHSFRWLVALAALPAVTCTYVLTDVWHGRARATAHVLRSEPFDELAYDLTSLEWLLVVETLLVIGYALFALGRTVAREQRGHRRQAALVVFAFALPTVAEVLGLAGVHVFGQRDLGPACFGLAALPLTWALYRRRVFDLVPIARHVVFAELPDPVIVLDARRRVVDANPSSLSTFGDGRTLVGRGLADVLPEGLDVDALSSDHAARASVTRGDHVFEVRAETFVPPGLDTRGYVLLFRDVTERERAAIASEERFRTLFDQSYQVMGVVDPDGTVLEANRTALEFVGADAAAVVGKPFVDSPWWRHAIDQQGAIRDGIAKAASGALVHLEVTLPDRLGNVCHFDFSLKPLAPKGDGRFTVLAEGRDITEHLRGEEERSALKEELHHAQKLDSIGRLAGGIAHDFNNLLTVILGQVELARLRISKHEEPSANLDQIAEAGESAASLTRQLLAFARKQPSEPSVVDPNRVIEETSRMLVRVIGEDVQLRLELEPHHACVRIDKGQLEQVLLNLAVNARDAMPMGGVLTLGTAKVHVDGAFTEAHGANPCERGFVRVRVRDTGVGMTRAVRERIFEPFFTTKGPGHGTGLGLATAYGVVSQAGGFIAVTSAPNEGATFDVFLPVAEGAPVERPKRADETPRGRERVALVEDQAAVRALATEQLAMLGYDVVAYATAEQALAMPPADLASIKLLVTDVVLGGMNGPSLAAELRKKRTSLPVLYVSGYTDDVVLQRGVDARADALVHKPFTLDELARAVRDAIDRERS